MPALTRLLPIDNNIPTAFHSYTDGSKTATDNLGSAAILTIEPDAGWHYGGCIYKKVHIGNTSNAGEHAAITWAVLWTLEAAEALAKYAATNELPTHTSQFWEEWLDNPEKLLALQWAWHRELMEAQDARVPNLNQASFSAT